MIRSHVSGTLSIAVLVHLLDLLPGLGRGVVAVLGDPLMSGAGDRDLTLEHPKKARSGLLLHP